MGGGSPRRLGARVAHPRRPFEDGEGRPAAVRTAGRTTDPPGPPLSPPSLLPPRLSKSLATFRIHEREGPPAPRPYPQSLPPDGTLTDRTTSVTGAETPPGSGVPCSLQPPSLQSHPDTHQCVSSQTSTRVTRGHFHKLPATYVLWR